MEALEYEAFRVMVNNLIKTDRSFRYSLANWLLHEDVILSGDTDNIFFTYMVDQVFDYISRLDESLFDEEHVDTLLDQLLTNQQISGFVKVIRIMHHLLKSTEISTDGLIKYLEKFEFAKSSGLDFHKTSKNLCEAFNPKIIGLFAKLNDKQRYLLEGLDLEQIDILSNFSPQGIKVLVKYACMTNSQRMFTFYSYSDQLKFSQTLGSNRIHSLLNLDPVQKNALFNLDTRDRDKLKSDPIRRKKLLRTMKMINPELEDLLTTIVSLNSEQFDSMKIFFKKHLNDLNSLGPDGNYVLSRIPDLNPQERSILYTLDELQLKIIKDLNEEEKDVLFEMENDGLELHEVIKGTKSFSEETWNTILSLNRDEFAQIIDKGYDKIMPKIAHLFSEGTTGLPLTSDPLSKIEDDFLSGLSSDQRRVLVKLYPLRPDGLKMMNELGPEKINEVLRLCTNFNRKNQRLTPIQMALSKRMINLELKERDAFASLTPVEWNVFRSIINSGEEVRSIVFNLSETGIRVLKAMEKLKEEHLRIVHDLSKTGLAVLASLPAQDRGLSNLIEELGKLDKTEARVLLNLSPHEKIYLLDRTNDKSRALFFKDIKVDRIDDESWFGWEFIRSSVPVIKAWNSDEWGTFGSLNKVERNLYARLNGERVNLLSDVLDSRIEGVLPFKLWTLLLEPAQMGVLALELPNLLRYIDQSVEHRSKTVELIATVITSVRLQENQGFDIENDVGKIIAKEFGKPFATVFYLNLLIRCTNDELGDQFSVHLIAKIRENEEDLVFLGKNYDFWDIERVTFFRWILTDFQSDHDFVRIIRSALFVLARDRNVPVLRKILSTDDGNLEENVKDALSQQFKEENYLLAKLLFRSRVSLSDPHIKDGSGSQWLASIFHKRACFKFLTCSSEITQDVPQSDEPVKTVLEYSLYYNRGDPISLLEKLDKRRVEKIFDLHSRIIIRSGARGGRLDLFRFFKDRIGDERLLRSIRFNDYEVLNSFMEDVGSVHASHSIQYYLNLSDILKWFAEIDPELDARLYRKICSEYILYIQSRMFSDDMNTIMGRLVNRHVTRNELEQITTSQSKTKFDLGQAYCGRKNKRSLQLPCVDSNDENETTKRGIEGLFDHPEKNIQFYDTLRTISKQVSKGETIDRSVREAFLREIRNIDPLTVDPKISDLVEEVRNNKGTNEEIRYIFAKSGVALRIEEVSSVAGLSFSVFQVCQHLVNHDIIGLTYDTLNLGVMPKIGRIITKSVLQLEVSAPIVERVFLNFFAYLGLGLAIRARAEAKDDIDKESADLNIITNSVFITMDLPVLITETMSGIGMEIGPIGELAGPVGMAVTTITLVVSHFIEVGLQVEKIAEQMDLTDHEKRYTYWSLFFTGKVPEEIESYLNPRQIFEEYLSEIFKEVQSNNYNQIAISLPSLLITVEEYLQSQIIVFGGISGNIATIFDLMSGGSIKKRNLDVKMNFTVGAKIIMNRSHAYESPRLSQTIPHKIGNHKLICGPKEGEMKKQIVNRTSYPFIFRYIETPFEISISRTIERWFALQNESDDCQNVVLYEQSNPNTTSGTMLLFMAQDSSIQVSKNSSIDLIFNGTNLSITDDDGVIDSPDGVSSWYHFTNELQNCRIRKSGFNFFYTAKDRLNCDLGGLFHQQNNTAMIRGSFIDSKNIHSIVGSVDSDRIEILHATYVDGKGGNDTIITQNSTLIQGYSGDSIEGNGVLLFPGIVAHIEMITVHNRTTIYYENGGRLKIDNSVLLRTLEGFLLYPTKVDNKTHIVTDLFIQKYVEGNITLEEELPVLRTISNDKFNLIKQLISNNYDIVLSDRNHHSFHQDKGFHNFYWEASDGDAPHLYLFNNTNTNVSISQANGIIDLRLLGIQFNETSSVKESDGRITIFHDILLINLLPNYKNIKITFDGNDYYRVVDGVLQLEHDSHALQVNGRFKVNGLYLTHHYNCIKFRSDKISFIKSNNDLVLISDKGYLSITDYYPLIQTTFNLSIRLNYKIIKPERFKMRANNTRTLRYYTVDERGLQIYHNQPVNLNQIGVIDLKWTSILNCDLLIIGNDLILSCQNDMLLRIESWTDYGPGREVMFAFKDCTIWNAECIITNCKPKNILEEFHKQQTLNRNILRSRKKRHIRDAVNVEVVRESTVTNDANIISSWINNWVSFALQSVHHSLSKIFPTPVRSDSQYFEPVDWFDNGSWITNNITVGALLFQTFVLRRRALPESRFIPYGKALVSAVNITDKFEQILRRSSGEFDISIVDIDYFRICKMIADHIWNGKYSCIYFTLYSIVETLGVDDEQFSCVLRNRIKKMLNG